VALSRASAVSPVTQEALLPGETRTHAGRIELQRKAPSTYFLVEAD